MTEPTPNVYKTDQNALVYRVRNRWEWATIYINPFKHIDEQERQGAEVMINSSYGVYGYCWGYMGEDWRKFLSGVDRDYAMRKMCSREFYEKPLDLEAFIALMKAEIDQWEKDWCDSWETIPDKHADENKIMREHLDQHYSWSENVHPISYFHAFNDAASDIPYHREMYDCQLWEVNPQVVHFWDKIWIPFTQHITKELAWPYSVWNGRCT